MDAVPGNLFDGVVLILLIIGILRGRKRGMSEEILSLFQVLTVLVVCGLYHDRLGQIFAKLSGVTLLYGYLFCYLAMLIIITVLFSSLKRAVGEKLVSSDLFGRLEYYLGMVAGVLRYFSYVVILIAVLHAFTYTEQEVRLEVKKQQDSLGDNFFPTLGQIHQTIVKTSLTGEIVRKHLSTVLIQPTSTAPPTGRPTRDTLKDKKTRDLERSMEK